MDERKKVLLVDDDPDFVEVNRLVLEQSGFDVVCAYDGEEGLQKARAEAPDVVVLDVMMGSLDEGFRVSRALRGSERTKDTPLIMLTAISSELPLDFEADDMWLPVDVFLEKPVEPDQLVVEVTKALGQ